MQVYEHVRRYLPFVILAVAIYAGWVVVDRHLANRRWVAEHTASAPAAANSEFERTYSGTGVKIVQFYAREGSVVEGSSTVICYGVANARAVRIEPAVEGVGVSPNRCIEVTPSHETRYTLTAEGSDGKAVSASFVIGVKADEETLPKITSFQVAGRQKDYRGRYVYLVRFAVQNPEEVSIDPPVFRALHRSPNGQFYVAPEATTTYTLTVTGKHGHKVRKQLTVEVPAG